MSLSRSSLGEGTIHPNKNIGILASGGPSPGINAVIASALIYANEAGVNVITIHDGFKWVMRGDISHVSDLGIDEVSRIHYRGGSFIGVARDNPTKDPKFLENTITSLLRLNIDRLITIGGDDTAFSAHMLEKQANGRIKVVHVPKTIDNDLNLPEGINTFGFQTARNVGAGIVENLMVDALTTTRWYFVIAMGRKAGHLALGVGKSTQATFTLIPEEFTGKNEILTMDKLADIIVGAIIKRKSFGRDHGVAVLAEGLLEKIPEDNLKEFGALEYDAHGNLRYAEVNFGEIIKKKVQKRLADFNLKVTIVAKNLGYEMRCADPIAYDMEYSRELGYCAAKFIIEGGNRAMVSFRNGKFIPMYLDDMIDPETGKMRIRMVNIKSESYQIARQYMIRLTQADFDDPHQLAKYAATAGISLKEFEKQFKHVVKDEDLYISSYAPEDLEKQKEVVEKIPHPKPSDKTPVKKEKKK